MKIAAALISALLTLGQSVFWSFFLLVVLNGFSEREGGSGLLAFGVIALIAIVASAFVGRGIASRLLARMPALKGWAVLMAVVLTSVLMAVVLCVGLVVAVAVASVLRA